MTICSEEDEGATAIAMINFLVAQHNAFLENSRIIKQGDPCSDVESWTVPLYLLRPEHLVEFDQDFMGQVLPQIVERSLTYGNDSLRL